MFPCCIVLLLNAVCSNFATGDTTPFRRQSTKDNFLLKLKGNITDCSCTIETVNQFNNAKIYPRISSIVTKDYFRFYKVNLRRECPFWKDSSHCAIRYCQVESCEEKDVPIGIKNYNRMYHPDEDMALKYLQPQTEFDCDEQQNDLGYLNTTISAETMEDFALWQAYDEAQDLYCNLPDEDVSAQYVDLTFNPERYTGYHGTSAQKVWSVIYRENCFRPENIFDIYIQSSKLNDMCIEKRSFYRVISGLHASINIHLCAQYLLSDQKSDVLAGCTPGQVWGPNIDEFYKRFSPEYTNEEGLQWLQNLYFLYLVELRALVKVSPYLEHAEYYTGYDKEDVETHNAVKNFLKTIKSFPYHFNETVMFSKGTEALQLKKAFRRHFRNISQIMDCVGCDKCRLWGKLQTQGLGTAFKILFSGKFDDQHPSLGYLSRRAFQLVRSEIVALFNAFARLSMSIYHLENFLRLLSPL